MNLIWWELIIWADYPQALCVFVVVQLQVSCGSMLSSQVWSGSSRRTAADLNAASSCLLKAETSSSASIEEWKESSGVLLLITQRDRLTSCSNRDGGQRTPCPTTHGRVDVCCIPEPRQDVYVTTLCEFSNMTPSGTWKDDESLMKITKYAPKQNDSWVEHKLKVKNNKPNKEKSQIKCLKETKS